MAEPLTKLTYQALQQGKTAFSLAHKAVSMQLRRWVSPLPSDRFQAISDETLQKLRQRLDAINETDWQDAEAGVYPESLLFDHPWDDFLRGYPLLWFDMPLTWERARQDRYQEFPRDVDTTGYPNYYLRNFHFQTDGYLSDWSANLYDLQVELLFNGSADAMRRRVLAPVKHALQPFDLSQPNQLRVLDVACGTGRTLRMLRGMLPKVALYGIDLSPTYLRKANQMLAQLAGEVPQLIQGNAEELPYMNNYFHAVTCVFLLHELPGPVRQTVLNEMWRVLKPGGQLVLCDSIQLSDSPEMAPFMTNFSVTFHEPFYQDYIRDDLPQRLTTAGFTDVTETVHFMSKYLVATKPAPVATAAAPGAAIAQPATAKGRRSTSGAQT